MNYLNSFEACLLKLNLVESSSFWCVQYLDFDTTHHIIMNQSVFSSLDHKHYSCVKLGGGKGHNVVKISNIDLRFTNGDVKNIP
jgi:hypothetical protein